MNRVVPWAALVVLVVLIEPVYPKAGNGRPPMPLERMLRIYFLQQWFNLSDPVRSGQFRTVAPTDPDLFGGLPSKRLMDSLTVL